MEDNTGGEASDKAAIVSQQKENIEIITRTTSVKIVSESSHKESSVISKQRVRFQDDPVEIMEIAEEVQSTSAAEEIVTEDVPVQEEVLVQEEVPVQEEVSVQEEIPVQEEVSVQEEIPVKEEIPVQEEVSVQEEVEQASPQMELEVELPTKTEGEDSRNSITIQENEEMTPEEVKTETSAANLVEEIGNNEIKMDVSNEEIEITSTIPETSDVIEETREEEINAEIQEEFLKSQLNTIIQDIDFEIAMEEKGPRPHTWQPKGTYNLEKTEITYDDVVAVPVPDVKVEDHTKPDPPKVTKKPKVVIKNIETNDSEGGSRRVLSMKVLRNSMINGEVLPVTEIPEGIPLLAKILPMENEEEREKIPLERLFTPATDWEEIVPQKKKAFASSCFYRPEHPTIDDQVELAHKISVSLIDEDNKTSRGQSMYIKRKNKSSKWIHGAGTQLDEPEDQNYPPQATKEKGPLKLIMKSSITDDFNSVQQHYEEILTSSQTLQQINSIELGKEIATNLQSPTGKGAALFAKRKKRMDKFIVDETTVQQQHQQPPSAVYEATSTVTTSSFQSKQESSFTSQQKMISQTHPTPIQPAQPIAAPQSGIKLPDLSNILTKPLPPPKKISTLEARGLKTQKSSGTKKQKQGFQPQSMPSPPARKMKTGDKVNQKPQNIPQFYNASASAGKQISMTNGFDATPLQDPLLNIRPGTPPLFMVPNGVDFKNQQMQSSLSSTIQSDQNSLVTSINDGGAIYKAEVKLVKQTSSIPASPIMNFQAPPAALNDMTTAEEAEKRKSFNLAPKGWGTYNSYYTPVHLGAR